MAGAALSLVEGVSATDPHAAAARLVVASAWLSRIVAALTMVYSLRALSRALAPPDYAVFIILVGLTAWFALSDLGLGYAVQNAVTNRLAREEDASDDILSAYLLLLVMVVIVMIALALCSQPMAQLLFAKVGGTGAEARVGALQRAGAVRAGATMTTKILYARHRGHIANIAAAGGSVVGVLLLVNGIDAVDNKVAYAFLALYGPNVLISVALCAAQIVEARRGARKSRRPAARRLLHACRGFFLFYFMAAAVLQVDYLIMSQKVAPKEIILYYSLAKVFSFVAFINQAVLFAAWPRMTAGFATGAKARIAESLRRLILGSSVVALVATLLVLALRHALADYLAPGRAVEFRVPVILGFGALALMRSVVDPFAIFLQSIGRLNALTAFAAAQAVIGGCMQWTLSERWGIEGILLALVISFLTTVAWGLPWATRRVLKSDVPNGAPRPGH